MNTYGLENLLSKEEKAIVAGLLLALVNLFLLGGHFVWLAEMPKRIGVFWTLVLFAVALCIMVIVNYRAMRWLKSSEAGHAE